MDQAKAVALANGFNFYNGRIKKLLEFKSGKNMIFIFNRPPTRQDAGHDSGQNVPTCQHGIFWPFRRLKNQIYTSPNLLVFYF
jgi:hypothetical protein